MAFSTEFIMGAGGGSGLDLNVHEQIVAPSSSATPLGEPYVIDEAGVYAMAGFGNLTNPPTSGSVILRLLVNGAEVTGSGAQAGMASVGCFTTRYLVAGDTITMTVSASGLQSSVLHEPSVAVSPIDTVGDGTAHTGGPIQMVSGQWTTLESHTVARSGLVLVDHAVNMASTASADSRIIVNGQPRIGNTLRATSDRWYRLLSVNAGDVVEAQAFSSSFTASNRVVNNWTITFH